MWAGCIIMAESNFRMGHLSCKEEQKYPKLRNAILPKILGFAQVIDSLGANEIMLYLQYI